MKTRKATSEEEPKNPKRRKTTKKKKDEDEEEEYKEEKKPSTRKPTSTRGRKKKESPNEEKEVQAPPSQDTQVAAIPPQPQGDTANIEVPEHAKGYSYMSWLTRGPPPHKGEVKIPQGKPYCLFGKHFLITGVLDSLEREDAWDLIKQYGGGVHKSIVKMLTHVIVGADPGPSKIEKLKQTPKVQLIKEADLFRMIETLPEQHPSNEELRKLNRGRPQRFASAHDDKVKDEKPIKKSAKTKGHHEPPKALPEETKFELWAEKYRPKSSDELIANPGVIEELRAWLKTWHLGVYEDITKKAVLISGPPGIGKTSAAWVIARETGFEPIEMNASDTRTKTFLEEHVVDATHNRTISDFFGTKKKVKKEEGVSHHMPCLIMDEVDGIYERGGITELITMINRSQIPIICICNDRFSPKLRALATHCLDIRFKRPSVAQSLPRMIRIAQLEGFEGDTLTLEKILESVHGDLRQALNTLQVWSSQGLYYSPELKSRLQDRIGKDAAITPIDAVMKLFLDHGKTVPIQDKIDLYFVDPSLEPLLVQENYLDVKPFLASSGTKKSSLEHMNAISRAADCISSGDVMSKDIYREQNFELMREHAVVSTVAPSHELKGFIQGAPRWPSWFGKTSHMKGNLSKLHYLHTHVRSFVSADSAPFRLDYLPVMVELKLVAPLEDPGGKEGMHEVLNFMDAYDLDENDWEVILDIGLGKSKYDQVPKSIRSQFEKLLKHHTHMKHTARASDEVKVAKRGKKKKDEQQTEEEEIVEDKELEVDD